MRPKKVCLTLILLIASVPMFGVGIPHLDLSRVVNSSDVIVIGSFSKPFLNGSGPPMQFRGQSLTTRVFSARLRVSRVIKGECPQELTLSFVLPDTFMGFRGPQPGLRMLFLKREDDTYRFTDPYYPDLPATAFENGLQPIDDPLTAVLRELANVIEKPMANQDRYSVLQKNYAIPTSEFLIAAIKRGILSAPDPETRRALQSELLQRGDLSELKGVSEGLIGGTLSAASKRTLLYAIGNKITSPAATDQILPLLMAKDGEVRTAAAEALWHIANPKTAGDIAPLLDDSESQVRYYATRALAAITGDNLWGPSIPEFEENGGKYVEHWRKWAVSNGYRHE